jgi:hypothetical protein
VIAQRDLADPAAGQAGGVRDLRVGPSLGYCLMNERVALLLELTQLLLRASDTR